MEVMAVNPIHRLVTPRLLGRHASSRVPRVAGERGGPGRRLLLQRASSRASPPGAYFSGFTALVQLPDLYSALAKACVFGFIAAMVACYKGLYAKGGPEGRGRRRQPGRRHHVHPASSSSTSS